MIVFKLADALSNHVKAEKQNGKKIGFVPTMGALHEGHISLIRSALAENDITVCSIFVNPSQFNNKEDFDHYPVTIEKDIEKLVLAGCNILFLPSVTEIYPPGYKPLKYDLGEVEFILEGIHRPGHFQGVCQVIDRLLNIINADKLYLGQKDFQQCMVVKKLIEISGENAPELRIMPTIREKDGLAMSSRNMRLDQKNKALATSIFNELETIKARIGKDSLENLVENAKHNLNDKGFQTDYVAILSAETLQPPNGKNEKLVGLVAASLGNVRLIDNMLLN